MNIIKVIPIFMFILISCTIFSRSPAREDTSQDQREEKCEEAEELLELLLNNPKIYLGYNYATIVDGDLGAAMDTAEARAIRDLSEAIEVEVQSDFEMIIIGTDTKVTQAIRDRIRTYTQAVLSGRQESEPFFHCPVEGQVMYFTWVIKAEYDAKVKQDMEKNKNTIITSIQMAQNEFAAGNYIAAVQGWIGAKQLLKGIFKTVPVRGEVEEGREVELNAYLLTEITNFFGKITVEVLNRDFIYDARGRMNKAPLTWVYYNDRSRKKPVFNLPLRVRFDRGSGEAPEEITTDSDGKAKIEIDRVDPSTRSARIKVEIDKDRIEGFDRFKLGALPSLSIDLLKKRTICLLISLKDFQHSGIKENSKNELTSILTKRGLGIANVNLDRDEVDGEVKMIAAEAHADYLMQLLIEVVQPPKPVGTFENLYRTVLSAKISVYEVPDGEQQHESIPELTDIEGFGSTEDNAIWNAYGNLREPISDAAVRLAANLQ